MNKLKTTILQGWPKTKSKVPIEIEDYWHYRDKLSVYNDIVFKGDTIVIPPCMRAEMIGKIH